MAKKKRKITTDDLLKTKFVEAVAMAPDEQEIALLVKEVAKDKKKYYSHIFMINADGTDLRQFTHGQINDGAPVFSSDGKLIAFVSKRDKKKGIYVMPRRGGEAKLLVEKDGDFSALTFSPDSKRIACVFRQNDKLPKGKDGKKEAPLYRHITRMFYKLDNYGFFSKTEGQVWSFDVDSGKGKRITRGGRGKEAPTYSPDGKYLAYYTNIRRNPDRDVDLTDLFVIPAKGGRARRIATPVGTSVAPSFSPDGKAIAYLGHDNPNDAWGVTNYGVWKTPLRGGKAVNLTKKLDRMALDLTISDQAESFGGMTPVWSADGKWIFFQVTDAGSTHLCRVSSSGRKLEAIIDGKLHVGAVALAGKKTKVAAIISYHNRPADIYLQELKPKAKLKRLTQFNKDMEHKVAIVKPEEIIFRSYDGYPVHGWILKPHNFSPKKKYPSILQIHGGPRVQYGNTFFHELQWLAAQGYVVYYANIRGGQGYGEKHADTITGKWGTVDHDDCMAFADYMEKKPYIDRRKMGVTGGSYGGYMTNWIVGQTNRFAAAVTQRSVVNLESFFGSSDIGFAFEKERFGTPYADREIYRKVSPLTYVKQIRTPLLIIHSEQDLRCPIEQAEQLFICLKMLNRKVEFIRFPGEPHGLSRCGRPDRRVARLEWIDKWFSRYLKGKE